MILTPGKGLIQCMWHPAFGNLRNPGILCCRRPPGWFHNCLMEQHDCSRRVPLEDARHKRMWKEVVQLGSNIVVPALGTLYWMDRELPGSWERIEGQIHHGLWKNQQGNWIHEYNSCYRVNIGKKHTAVIVAGCSLVYSENNFRADCSPVN